MKTGVFSAAKRWALALGLAVATALPAVSTPAAAAPVVPMIGNDVPAVNSQVIDVRSRRWHRDRYSYRRGWDRPRYERYRHYRRHSGAGVALGLGLGVPLGAYLATRPAYDPYYYNDGYYVQRVAPRPVYRSYGGNRHVNWCFNRYRSYRAWDNSFQPYHGPRQQCYSPFS